VLAHLAAETRGHYSEFGFLLDHYADQVAADIDSSPSSPMHSRLGQ